jgi:lauroyl/myristoyl acyltransferase
VSAENPTAETPPHAVSGFKRLRYKLEFLGLKFVEALVPRLPYAALQPLANALGFVFFHLDSRGRAVAIENLRVAFGSAHTPAERTRIARKSCQNFARTMLCLFWSSNLTPENYQNYIRVEGLDNHPIHRDKNSPGVYFLTHFCNFEWISLASSFAVTPGLVITQTFKNPSLGPIFDSLRARGGHTIIPPSRALIRMIKLLRAGGKVGAAADLSINPKHGAVPVRCFGLWTSMSPIAGILSERGGAGLVPSQIFPEPDGRFRLVYHPPLDLPQNATHQQIAQACWDIMEPMIAKNPELWLWSYKQWRYKPSTAPEGQYPFYANATKRFDEILEGQSAPGGTTSGLSQD